MEYFVLLNAYFKGVIKIKLQIHKKIGNKRKQNNITYL